MRLKLTNWALPFTISWYVSDTPYPRMNRWLHVGFLCFHHSWSWEIPREKVLKIMREQSKMGAPE